MKGDFGYQKRGYSVRGGNPFVNNANNIMNSVSPPSYGGNMDPYQGYSQNMGYGGSPGFNMGNNYSTPQLTAQDMYYMMLLQEKAQNQENKKKNDPTSKTAELLMQSLDRQNQMLAQLAGNIGKERDEKLAMEAKEIENKIRLLEFETQAKQHQLFSQNIFENLSKNYNRKIFSLISFINKGPFPNNDYQKYDNFIPGITPNMMSPGQLLQLQSLFQGPGGGRFMPGGIPPFVALPSQLMR